MTSPRIKNSNMKRLKGDGGDDRGGALSSLFGLGKD